MNGADDFDWNDDHTVVKSVRAVAVYRNSEGDIVIRQEASPTDSEDFLVIVPIAQAKAVIGGIRRAIKERE